MRKYIIVLLLVFISIVNLQAKNFDLEYYKGVMKYYDKLQEIAPFSNETQNPTYFGYFNTKEEYEANFPNVKITKVIKNFNVEKCVDGDTLKGFYFDENNNFFEMTVRILLIDAFETHKGKKAEKQAQILKDITEWNKKYITVDTVIEKGKEAQKICENHFKNTPNHFNQTGITLFCWKKDKFNRDLCFVINEQAEDYYIDTMIFSGRALPYKPY